MKVRTGFVSNSSSSSFILFGIRFNEHDNEKAETLAKETGLKVKYGEYNIYVGLVESGEIEHDMIGDMKDDETRIQFIERVKNSLPETIRDQADWYSESWYNG